MNWLRNGNKLDATFNDVDGMECSSNYPPILLIFIMPDSSSVRRAVFARLLIAGAAWVGAAHSEVLAWAQDFEAFTPGDLIANGGWSVRKGSAVIDGTDALSEMQSLALLPGIPVAEVIAPLTYHADALTFCSFTVSRPVGTALPKDGVCFRMTGVSVAFVSDDAGRVGIRVGRTKDGELVWHDTGRSLVVSADPMRVEATVDYANRECSLKFSGDAGSLIFDIPRESITRGLELVGDAVDVRRFDDWSVTLLTDEDRSDAEGNFGGRRRHNGGASKSSGGTGGRNGQESAGRSDGSNKGTGTHPARIKKTCKIVIISPANGDKV